MKTATKEPPTAGQQDGIVRAPTTYGEEKARGHFPGTVDFDDPYWWQDLGSEIDKLRSLAKELWGVRRAEVYDPGSEAVMLQEFPWLKDA